MAGDWIKLQKDTPDKPEVLAISARLGIDQDAVTGKLVRIWAWFDTHTTDGNASCVTYAFLDRLSGVTGFAEQMALVGWLEQNGSDLRLPNFDYHTGETAKRRALGKNRAEKHRSNAVSNDASVTETSLEKRREEKRREEQSRGANARPKGTRLQAGWLPSAELKAWAEKERPELDLASVADEFRDYWIAQPGSQGVKLDWGATFRNWVRRQRAEAAVPPKSGNAWWTSEEATLAKAREFGMTAQGGEDWNSFRKRIADRIRAAA